MNPVEILEAVSDLATKPFDPVEFPFSFLDAFGNKPTTIARLRSGASNSSDIPGGVLQRSHIHIATCPEGETARTLAALSQSPKTASAKARFTVTTDGVTLEAEDLTTGETVACAFADFPDRFGFFLPLAGISTVKQIRESAFDVRATGRLNKLYLQLRKDNPEWDLAGHDMNNFMARLIFCFFAEDTDIFHRRRLFTETVEQMSAQDSSNTHEVIETIFRAMDFKTADRGAAKLPRWAEAFPYVNGGLFAGGKQVPRFSKIARAYLLHIGHLEWRKINPDIFGSMIQALAYDEERGALGMHYTSVPNILKVLNPLFLDGLRAELDEAGENARRLLNLRKRISRMRVFDPACGSGNFLVIAYKELRMIEAEINRRRGEGGRKTEIPITNFRGIELHDFPAEIARLALIIAEFQCDTLYRGQKEALQEFLPLDTDNWITRGNALRLDWTTICPPAGTGVKHRADDLFQAPVNQSQTDFANEGGETFICGNPPYVGDKLQNDLQKSDMESLFEGETSRWKSFDYVCGFFLKAAQYVRREANSTVAFVSTNSVCQGVQASQFWQLVLRECAIVFAHTSFKWSNLASKNAGVMCVIVGLAGKRPGLRQIYSDDISRQVENISPYLTSGPSVYVTEARKPISELPEMLLGNVPKDGGSLLFTIDEQQHVPPQVLRYVRPTFGAQEFIQGFRRFCLWISDAEVEEARSCPLIAERLRAVSKMRSESKKRPTREWADRPHRFVEIRSPNYRDVMIVPRHSSESRPYLPVGYLPPASVVLDSAFALYDAPLWSMSVIASRLHLVWIATVCGKLKTDFRYSNTLGWNTFPVPILTETNRADLTRCAEDILLAREAHFPATIADLYASDKIPPDLRAAHERNDEVLERIYIGRRFRNDTERLEKLFELYTKMISITPAANGARNKIKEARQ
ncbi:hypothetical protein ACVWWK_003003 [Bradyrhizobium sp. LB9.1b]